MHDATKDSISALISSMIFISETESPLNLLEWTDVPDRLSLFQKIEAYTSIPIKEQLLISADDFLKGIQQMAEPADELMVDYARSYSHLFALLFTSLTDLQVIKAGRVNLHLFIVGFLRGKGCIAIHATATET